jgi:hypothetical protein
MNVIEKTISDKMEGYLHDVRAVLEANRIKEDEIVDLLDNLYCHALETVSSYLERMSLENAVNRTMASLEAPESYASYSPQSPTLVKNGVRNYSDWLGKLSALTMILALLLSVLFFQQKLFDTPFSGSIFIFGEMLALGTGIATWPNIWAKVGTLCSALLLAFLATAFLWMTFSKTA